MKAIISLFVSFAILCAIGLFGTHLAMIWILSIAFVISVIIHLLYAFGEATNRRREVDRKVKQILKRHR